MTRRNGPPADGAGLERDRVADAPRFDPETAEAADGVHDELLPLREPFRTIFRTLGGIEQVAGALLLVMILVLVLSQVAQRYVPGAWPWTGELARYSMVWAAFAMAGYLVAHHPYHIAIHIVDFVAKGRWLAAVKLLANVVILATTGLLLYGSYNLLATDIGQVTPAAEIPLRFVNAVPLVGLVLIAVRAVLGIAIRDVPALFSRRGHVS
jgi:TRAP-type C4-dicarboxylate transport system permease small subunit